jgi:hypothetical protein
VGKYGAYLGGIFFLMWSASEYSKMIREGLGASQAPMKIKEGGCQAKEEIAFS